MKRWALRKVMTVQFSPTTKRHAVDLRGRTRCANVPTELAATHFKGTIEERPIKDISCVRCLKWGGFLPPRKGKCLIAQRSVRAPAHLVRKVKIGRGTERLRTPVGCNLDFTKFPKYVRRGTYRDVTCCHCFLEAVEMP